MILGSHQSTAGGFAQALPRARRDRCETFQVFCTSSRQWRQRPLDPDDVAAFRQGVAEAGFGPIASHASYLINLAAPDPEIRKRSIAALVVELQRCRDLGIGYSVLHPGAHVGAGERRGVARIASALNRVLEQIPSGVMLLLENTAGQGSCVGHRFEHLRDILGGLKRRRRVGICFDTQHAFAAGYDLRHPDEYQATFADLHRKVGLHKLKAFHLNDSKRDLGSRVDRHENIGLGHLGLPPFRMLVNDPRFSNIPGYLETPPYRGKESFARNLRVLRRLTTTA